MATYTENSRYYKCDNEYNIPQSPLLKEIYEYNYITVLPNETGRLDLVSYRVYSTPVYWWLIARCNAIINPDTLQPGVTLRVPILN